MDKRGSEPFGTIRLSVENRENHYELTEESAQELKMAIRMAAKKARERRNILNQIPAEAEYPRVPLYRRRDLIAVLSLSIALLVTILLAFAGEKKAVSWLSNTSASVDGSTQLRLNLDSETPAPDGKSLKETPNEITPVRENIGSEEIKGKTSSLKGRTRKIHKWKTKGLRGRTQPVLASNIGEKECLEQQLRRAFLLSTSRCN